MYVSIIPIGSFCQVADQLNEKGLPYARTPWEYTVTPLQALLDAVRDDGSAFGLEVERFDNDGTVICKRYGHLHHHDFSRDFANGNKIMPLQQEEIDTCRSKFLHKMETFRKAARAEGKKLYIRLAGEGRNPIAWPYLHDPDPLKHSRLNELAAALEEYADADFDLLFVYYRSLTKIEDDEPLDRRIKLNGLPNSIEMQSTGDSGPWLDVFRSIGVVG